MDNFNEIPEKPGNKPEAQKKKPSVTKRADNSMRNKFIKTRNYLYSLYDFRYNVIAGNLEYRTKNSKSWHFLDDRMAFNLTDELVMEEDIYLSKTVFDVIINSKDVSPEFNPFEDYLFNLPKWDGERDYITEFLTTQVTLHDKNDQEYFLESFKKWFVALVGSLIADRVVNHACLILVGPQGRFKTTFINSIIPKHLQLDYLYLAKFNAANKDHEIYLGTKMMINLDELATLNRVDIESLKSTITQQTVILRKPWGRMDTRLWRRASFAGSINKGEFLSDFTGSRRFLVLEVDNITINHEFNLDMMYAQGLALFKSGYKFHFDNDDIELIEKQNEKFQNISMEEELLLKHFRIPTESDLNYPNTIRYFTTTDIAMFLSNIYNKINVNDTYKNRIGLAMTKLGFQKTKRRLHQGGKPARVWVLCQNEDPAKYMSGGDVF